MELDETLSFGGTNGEIYFKAIKSEYGDFINLVFRYDPNDAQTDKSLERPKTKSN
jgi:hypothetical protein